MVLMLIIAVVSVFPFPKTVKASATNPMEDDLFRIWMCSDMHVVGAGYNGHTSLSIWSQCIADAISLDMDVAINNGDWIDFPETHGYSFPTQMDNFWNNPSQTYGWADVADYTYWDNITVGNHDGGWGVASEADGLMLNWTHTIGNICFIGIGDYAPDENSYTYRTLPGLDYNQGQDIWLNQTIANNVDKNIFILCHSALSCTDADNLMDAENSTIYEGMLEYWNNSGHPVDAWLWSHDHRKPSEINIETFYGTEFISSMAISQSGKSGSYDSIFLDITNDSTTVTIRGRENQDGTWYNNFQYPSTFDMTYPFDFDYVEEQTPSPSESDTTEFLSINNATNGSITSISTRNYSGTVKTGLVFLQIQIANDSSFADVFMNTSGINETNYGADYWQNNSVWTFFDVNTIESYGGGHGKHYYRVRPRIRVVTP